MFKFPINVPTIECLKKVYKERCGIQVSSDSGSLLWPRLAEPDYRPRNSWTYYTISKYECHQTLSRFLCESLSPVRLLLAYHLPVQH